MLREIENRLGRRPALVQPETARGEIVRNFGSFTRGSQLVRLRYMMLLEGLRWPALAGLSSFAIILILLLTFLMQEHEIQLVEMRIFAWFWHVVDLDPTHMVNLTLPDDTMVPTTIGDVPSYPEVARAWTKFVRCIVVALGGCALLTTPLTAWFVKLSQKIGVDILKERQERGATLVSAEELAAEIAAYNRVAFVEELGRNHPALDPARTMVLSVDERVRLGVHAPYTIAGIAYPWRLEQTHAMLIGTTGSGKTTQLRRMVAEARARGHRCVVFDLTGAFVEAFYREGIDTILNPMDERCPPWTIFNDCDNYADFISAAAALIPSDGANAEPFWAMAARTLFVEMCVKLKELGETSNGAITHHLMSADLKSVHQKLEDTIASPLTAVEAARMAESIRAVFNTNAQALRFLPDPVAGGREPFSIRRWVQEDPQPGSILFITSTHTDLTLNRALLTLWMDLAVNALMGMPRTRDLRMWYLFDEVHALHRLPAIEHGLQTSRGFGGAFVLGMHSFDKLAETYGEQGAINLASLARTKLILTTADRSTADVCSEFIGSREVRESDEAYSIGASRSRDAATITPRTEVKPLVMADDIMNLRSLNGYVKFPEGFPAARIRLVWEDYPAVAEPFLRLKTLRLASYRRPDDDPEPAKRGGGGPGPIIGSGGATELVPDDRVVPASGALRPEQLQLTYMGESVTPQGESSARMGEGVTAKPDDGTSAQLPANGITKDPERFNWKPSSPDDDGEIGRVAQTTDPGVRRSIDKPAPAKREQQITIEVRTGQATADPSENHPNRHGASHNEPAPSVAPDDGMDFGI